MTTLNCLVWLVGLSLAGWLYLILVRGAFWPARPLPEPDLAPQRCLPDVVVVMPARNEAAYVGRSLRSLMAQDYPGRLGVFLVDDGSKDGTRAIAEGIAATSGHGLEVIAARPLPDGWSGKLWANAEGLRHAWQRMPEAPYVLFTDADIEHDPSNLRRLVAKAEADRLDLVSLMVRQYCQSLWERLLAPAFLFFFRELYPLVAVNRQRSAAAAANGGCMLVRRAALERVGGLEAIRDHLIDDVALAQRIKHYPTFGAGRIWVGLTGSTHSLRGDGGLGEVWSMVARYADTELNHSLPLLALSVLATLELHLVPPLAAIGWPLHGSATVAALGLAGWLCMTLAYWPIVRLHRLRPSWALTLPLAAALYAAMTIDSAMQYRRGRGGRWKGRVGAPAAQRPPS